MMLSQHAMLRMQQRGFRRQDVEIVMECGTIMNAGGAVFFFMAKKDIPSYLPGSIKDRLLGITLVVNPETNDVVTLYKNRDALKDIRKKDRYLHSLPLKSYTERSILYESNH